MYLLRGRQGYGWPAVVLCGCWIGLGVSHKLLLGAVGMLPLVVLAGILWRSLGGGVTAHSGILGPPDPVRLGAAHPSVGG